MKQISKFHFNQKSQMAFYGYENHIHIGFYRNEQIWIEISIEHSNEILNAISCDLYQVFNKSFIYV